MAKKKVQKTQKMVTIQKKSAVSKENRDTVTTKTTLGIRPLSNRVLIRPFTKQELEPKNSFGLILPTSNSKEKAEQGVVLAIGPGMVQDGVLVPMTVAIGDTVAFSKYGYEDIQMNGEELYLIKEENVLAILNK